MNMEPENHPIEKEYQLLNLDFWGFMLFFQDVYMFHHFFQGSSFLENSIREKFRVSRKHPLSIQAIPKKSLWHPGPFNRPEGHEAST